MWRVSLELTKRNGKGRLYFSAALIPFIQIFRRRDAYLFAAAISSL